MKQQRQLDAAETTGCSGRHGRVNVLFSPLSFLQVILPIIWTRGPGQMVMVTSELE